MAKKTIGKHETPTEKQERTTDDSTVLRWQNDKKYRESQKVHGWTEDCCRYLNYLTTIDMSYSAAGQQRNRYENTILLVSNDDKQAGLMRAREDFKSTTHNLAVLQREQGRQNAYTPKNERARQRPFDEASRADLSVVANFLFIIFTTMVATRTPRRSMARSTVVERLMPTDSFNAKEIFSTNFAYRH